MVKKPMMILAVVAILGMFALALAAQRVKVESNDGRYKRYRTKIDRDEEVILVNRLSDASCTRGKDWGFDSSGIWVDHGCRAMFEIRRRGGGNGNGGDWNGGGNNGRPDKRIRLESTGDWRKRYNSDRDLRNVKLARTISSSPCIQNRTWGWDRRQVWVDNGCRADFDLYYR
jgi:hypothetical protein